MSRGIYILANDRVIDNAIALLNSIRVYDADSPIVMIPYNNQYQAIADIITKSYGVQIYEDLQLLENIDDLVKQTCGENLLDRPNLLRKLACWFGPFDEFLYIDTDIVVFEKIIENLNYLANNDFICCDYQYTGGIKQVFTPQITEIFTEDELKDVFNSGFWGSKKTLITQQDLQDTFTFCASHPEYFYLLNSDQTILNYLVLKRISRRFNIVRENGKGPGNWAGSPHFKQEGNKLVDPKVNQPLKFVHWAGVRLEPGGSYWDIWEHYRYLNEPKPAQVASTQKKKSLWQQIKDKIRG
ncbi:Npun_R2821/Npun_R2822 family protein [Coleofasciculus sp. H7-2]|uniref:Npun_R2821/Npun_R2822 family protein n=1 Tax=Coleofasciculus sp. H7-2 TaxID=3351545 RepID=UPI00366AB376